MGASGAGDRDKATGRDGFAKQALAALARASAEVKTLPESRWDQARFFIEVNRARLYLLEGPASHAKVAAIGRAARKAAVELTVAFPPQILANERASLTDAVEVVENITGTFRDLLAAPREPQVADEGDSNPDAEPEEVADDDPFA